MAEQLAQMQRIIEIQGTQMKEMQAALDASRQGSGRGNGGSGAQNLAGCSWPGFGGTSSHDGGSDTHGVTQYMQIWPAGRGHKREREATSYELAKLAAEAAEDERNRRVRLETLRAVQGGY